MSSRSSDGGLTTVVFADVEGSTALLDRVGDQDGTASIHRQLDVLRERVANYDGAEVKSLGDGLMLTFSSPRQAVLFALASQRALTGTAPRIRIGINTGEVIEANTDPLGRAVNAASRIAGRAGGGEVVVSDVVRQLVGVVPAVRFLDRGRCRLKGFSDRWHLWIAQDGVDEHRSGATIGRGPELASIAELISSTAAGTGQVLLFEGEAGIGKTHLVAEAIALARRDGIQVIEVAADELVRRPGALAHRLMESTRAGQAPRARLEALLNHDPGVAAPDADRSYAIVDACLDLLEGMTRSQPVIIAMEDLHWADELSIAILTAVTRRVSTSRCSVIGALRPSPRPPALDRMIELVRDGRGRHIRVDSLDEVDVVTLASALIGAAPSPRLRQRLGATAGNPLYVTELLRSLDDDGLLRVEAGVADVGSDVTPGTLNETLVRRLSWLPRETLDLLRMASLLGGAFTLRDLSTVTGRSVIDTAAWLREASLAGLVIGEGERLAFRHDLVRDAVYGHMLATERRDLHHVAGRALANAGAPTQQVAQQLSRGALHGDLEAVAWLERAAIETTSISPAAALVLFADALALAPANWTGRQALQAKMIEPLAWCGRFDEGEALAKSVLVAPADAQVEFAALIGLCSVYGSGGKITEAIDATYRAAGAAGAPPGEAQQQLCIAAQLSVLIARMSAADAKRVGEETLAKGVADGDLTTQCLAHQTLSTIAMVTGYAEAALAHLVRAVALLDTGRVADVPYLIPDTLLAHALIDLDAVDEALAAAADEHRRAGQRATRAVLPAGHISAGGAHYVAGRWDEATAEIEAGLAMAEETGSLTYVLFYRAGLAAIALHRDERATAEIHLAEGTRHLAGAISLYGADWLFGVQSEFLALSGQHDAALDLAELVWAQTAPIRYGHGYLERGIFLVREAVALGRDDLARSVTADIEEGARRSPASSTAGAAGQCRGMVDRNADALLDAVATYRKTPRRPALAACIEDAARLLIAAGRRDEAVALLREAATLYADIDAAGDAARVAAALRELGVRVARSTLRRPSFGWESLTPMESNVSKLVAEGLTNPEIGARLYTSRRTVETHLSHVFQKLGISSRTHLAAEFARRATPSSEGSR